MIKKSMALVRKETMDSIAKTINDSGLPMFVVVSILKDLLEQANVLANEEYKTELVQYESAVKQEGGENIAGN